MVSRPAPTEIDREARLRAPPQVAPTQPPAVRIRNFDEVYLPWTPEMVMAEASRCIHCTAAPCVKACPLATDIPAALWLTEQGDFDGAARIFQSSNNLLEICSRICPQSERCEGACPHCETGNLPVAIGRIEAFLADRSRKDKSREVRRQAQSGHRVAVVGSGPAGLTVAELLALQGHSVTVFEEWPHGGGLLRYGIPRFKLDHGMVRERLEYLHEMGVAFVFDTRIGEAKALGEMFSEGFEAVFLGTGPGRPAAVPFPGDHFQGVYAGRPFLVRANVEQDLRPSELEDPPEVGQRVAVVGGGNTAVDCSRTAIRLGAEAVTCYYRRSRADMPGTQDDWRLAREEGVAFEWQVAPARILGDPGGRARGVRFLRTRQGDPDASGRPRPVVVPDSHHDVPADTVILALGTSPDPYLPRRTLGLEATREGLIVVESETGRTTRPCVWAGGGAVSGPSPVPDAVAQARRAAWDIHMNLVCKKAGAGTLC